MPSRRPGSGARSLPSLFREVDACRMCAGELDPSKTARIVAASPKTADIFVVGQALAGTTQRITGVPFFGADGDLSETGERLEQFLNRVGATLRPSRAVKLPGGRIAAAAPGLAQVFCSEIIKCYPGKGKKGDLFPRSCADRCLAQRFLAREIALVRPRLVLTLGNKSGIRFWKHSGGRKPYRTLGEGIRAEALRG